MIRIAIASLALLTAGPSLARDQVAEVEAVERAWNAAIVSRDTAALDRILAAEFRLIWINGQIVTKAEQLAALPQQRVTIDPFETEERDVRVYGETAVVTGAFDQTARLDGKSETNRFRYTDVYIWRDGRWQAVVAQAALIRPPRAAQ